MLGFEQTATGYRATDEQVVVRLSLGEPAVRLDDGTALAGDGPRCRPGAGTGRPVGRSSLPHLPPSVRSPFLLVETCWPDGDSYDDLLRLAMSTVEVS